MLLYYAMLCAVCGKVVSTPYEYVLKTQHGIHTMYLHKLHRSGTVDWKPRQKGARRFPSPQAAYAAMGPCKLGNPKATLLRKRVCDGCRSCPR